MPVSPSSRGRGLKYSSPFTIWHSPKVALFTRAWIEIQIAAIVSTAPPCRPLHEGVDWNRVAFSLLLLCLRRPLHEGVDWNTVLYCYRKNALLSPSSRGRGLKSRCFLIAPALLASPSSRGRGLKFLMLWIRTISPAGRPLYEGVDWNVDRFGKPCNDNTSPSLRGRGLK